MYMHLSLRRECARIDPFKVDTLFERQLVAQGRNQHGNDPPFKLKTVITRALAVHSRTILFTIILFKSRHADCTLASPVGTLSSHALLIRLVSKFFTYFSFTYWCFLIRSFSPGRGAISMRRFRPITCVDSNYSLCVCVS